MTEELKHSKLQLTDSDEFTLISSQHYEHLKQFKYHKNYEGYVNGYINQKKWRLHRYIMEVLLKHDIIHKSIDHIDRDRLNNTDENLSIASDSENARNKTKALNTTSKYMGVSKKDNLWIAQINIKDTTGLRAYYKNEHHAAHNYNLWLIEYKFDNITLNNVPKEELKDFVLYKAKEKKDLPKGIHLVGKKFKVLIKKILYGYFDNLDDAIIKADSIYGILEEEKHQSILNTPIQRNNKKEAIIEMFNKDKIKTGETIIDDDLYYILVQNSWYMNSYGYVVGKVNNKLIYLHKYICQLKNITIPQGNCIDHKNGQPLDNRFVNLSPMNDIGNSQNKASAKNSSSKYVGVSFDKRSSKWEANITINHKKKNLGYFKDEIEAAKVRDIAAKKYFFNGRLNFPEELE